MPAAISYRERAENGGCRGRDLLAWRNALEESWNTARFVGVDVQSRGDRYTFSVQVDLGTVDPDHVRVELYADGLTGQPPMRQVMARSERAGPCNRFLYTADVVASRAASDFTPRLVPVHEGASVPLEGSFILWSDRDK